jgi:hypothetical protein
MAKPGPTRKDGPGTLVGVRCQSEFLARVDRWREGQPILPTRAAALRYLAEVGLEAVGANAAAAKRSRQV